jgi:septum formation protein
MSPPSARSGSGSPTPERAPRLILASASPRRREILRGLGVDFEAIVPDVEELSEGDPEEVVVENARRKARWGMAPARSPEIRISGHGAEDNTWVLGVDTDVALDGELLGKATDAAAARERLERLSGRTHLVLSGLVVAGAGGEREAVACTEVTFNDLNAETIDLYLASGEWRDRAGAYAIQGLGSILVASIRGDFSNVVGLPVPALLELIPGLRP